MEMEIELIDEEQNMIEMNYACAASGPGRCRINNGGCWHDTKDGITFSACMVRESYRLSVLIRVFDTSEIVLYFL